MTERDQPEDRDYPDGSVGRYVREKWGSAPARPARAARPYVPPVEPPSPRPAPDVESDHVEADSDEMWAYQPDWPHRPDAPEARREATETDHTRIDPARAASSHDPFEGVEYGSATWGAARAEEERAANDDAARNGEVEPGPPTPPPGLGRGRPRRGAESTGAGPAAPDGGQSVDPADAGRDDPRGSERSAAAARPRRDRGGAENPPPARRKPRSAENPSGSRRDPRAAADPVTDTGSRRALRSVDDPASGPLPRRDHRGADAAQRRQHGTDPANPRHDHRGADDSATGAGQRRDFHSPDDQTGTGPRRDFHGNEGPAAPRRDYRGIDDPVSGPVPRRDHRGADDPVAQRHHGADDPVSGPMPRDHRGEPSGTGPYPRMAAPGPADDDVTTRTAPTPPHPPVGMPPGAFAAGPPEAAPQAVRPQAARPAMRDAHWTDPVAVAAQEAQRARSPERSDLSSARLLRNTKRPPQSGWRRMIYVLSGRMFNPGESPTDIRRRQLTARVNQPLLGCYKIAMLSLKGGVGKTTMTATLGATFASLRGDRVVAVDANPDRGTLSQKIPLETSATVRNLLRDSQRVRRYTDVRAYTSQGPSRLEVLASEQDPAVSEAYSEDDYRRTVNLLEHFYNIVLTDCGTGLMHSAMYGVLGVADQLVIVSSGSIDGARSASATMDWLDAHGHGDLVANAVVVINFVHRSRGGVDLDRVSEHFAARCRSVVRIPFDAHLEEGAEIDLDRLEPNTRMALLELAANVADAFERVHAL